MARLLIVAYYFPPLNTIASLRPASWAKYWARAGHEIGVLTAQKSARDGSLDLALDPAAARAARIVEVPYLSVRSLGGGRPAGRADARTPGAVPAGGRVRGLVKALSRFTGINPLSPHAWVWNGVAAAQELYREWPYDAVVSTFGPPACHIIATLLKRRLPVFWAADYRDLWNDSSLLTGAWPFSRIERGIEDHVVGRADLITTVSDPWRLILARRFGDRVVTIENGFDREDLLGLDPKPFFPEDGKIRLVYTGTFYPERQSPEPLFRALALLRSRGLPVDERVEALFYGVKAGALEKLAVKHGVQRSVQARGYVDRRSVLRIQRDADLLIFLDWLDDGFPGMMTGKLYEYLYAGVPVLCVGGGGNTDAARFIGESGMGFVPGASVETIADTLAMLLRGEPISCAARPETLARCTRERFAGLLLDEITKRLPERRR